MELRLDFLQDLNLEHPADQLQDAVSFAASLGLKTVLTLRPKWEGCVTTSPDFVDQGPK